MKRRLMSTALMAVVLFTLAFMTPALAPAVYAHQLTVTVDVTGFITASIEASSNHKRTRIVAGPGFIDSFNTSFALSGFNTSFAHELLCEPDRFLIFGSTDDFPAVPRFFTGDSEGTPDRSYSNLLGFPYRDFDFKSDSLTFQSIDWLEEIGFTPAAGITCTIERFNIRVEFNADGSTTIKFNHFATKDFPEPRGKSGRDKTSTENHGHNIEFSDPVVAMVSEVSHP